MEFENIVDEDHMATSLLDLLSKPLSWIFVFALPFTFVVFFISGSFSVLVTSTVLILSTVLFIFFKREERLSSVKEEKEKEKEKDKSALLPESSIERKNLLASKQQQHESAISTQQKEASEHQIQEYQVRSPDVLSENESTTEDSEMDWPFPDNTDGSPDYSDDGSISDEDSLIEISLPGGHYVSHNAAEPSKYSMEQQQQHKLPDFMPESNLQKRSPSEILAEFNDINEEDNLIEIDISMGSIKCSRFEIEV